jgi:carboxymethylenebutenolidase
LSAALAANDGQLRGAIIYYGSLPAGIPIEPIRAPLLGFYGENDKRITDAVPDFSASLKAAGKSFEYHVYPDAPHAFFNDTRPSYHVSSARDAFVRTLDFLRGALA